MYNAESGMTIVVDASGLWACVGVLHGGVKACLSQELDGSLGAGRMSRELVSIST